MDSYMCFIIYLKIIAGLEYYVEMQKNKYSKEKSNKKKIVMLR